MAFSPETVDLYNETLFRIVWLKTYNIALDERCGKWSFGEVFLGGGVNNNGKLKAPFTVRLLI